MKPRPSLLKFSQVCKCGQYNFSHADFAPYKSKKHDRLRGAIKHKFRPMTRLELGRWQFKQIPDEDKRHLFASVLHDRMKDVPRFHFEKRNGLMSVWESSYAGADEEKVSTRFSAAEVLEFMFKFKWSMIGL